MFAGLWFFNVSGVATPGNNAQVIANNIYGMKSAQVVNDPDLHPFYVSSFEFNHNSRVNNLEITCKIFADDLEAVLKSKFSIPVDLSVEANKLVNEKLISAYIKEHLALSVDGILMAMQFLGFEKDKDAVYCYLEITDVVSLKKLDVKNSMLYDGFKEQANIMHVIANGKRQSSKLDNPKQDVSFQL
jgi:hypothetical protein